TRLRSSCSEPPYIAMPPPWLAPSALLLLTMLLSSVSCRKARMPPPAWIGLLSVLSDTLLSNRLFVTVVGPSLARPPPPRLAVLLRTWTLVSASELPKNQMPPPEPPLIVLLAMVVLLSDRLP